DAYIGRSIAGVGDVNHDGVADLLVSAEGVNGYAGDSYLLYGHTGAWQSTIDLSNTASFQGSQFPGRVIALASASDMNGDGIPDFVIGNDQPNNATGAAYVVYGKAGGFPASFSVSDLNG